MKKAKIVLAAIAVLGIAGGALAMKAEKMYGAQLWITTVYDQPATVSVEAITVASGTKVYTTAIPNARATVYTATAFQAQ